RPRHSGARAKRANPESRAARARGPGFRVRPLRPSRNDRKSHPLDRQRQALADTDAHGGERTLTAMRWVPKLVQRGLHQRHQWVERSFNFRRRFSISSPFHQAYLSPAQLLAPSLCSDHKGSEYQRALKYDAIAGPLLPNWI